MVRGTGQDQGLEAEHGACVLGHQWFHLGWRVQAGPAGPREPGSSDELWLLGEVGPRERGPSTEAGQDLMEGPGAMLRN